MLYPNIDAAAGLASHISPLVGLPYKMPFNEFSKSDLKIVESIFSLLLLTNPYSICFSINNNYSSNL